jgi:hypothetical protein
MLGSIYRGSHTHDFASGTPRKLAAGPPHVTKGFGLPCVVFAPILP